MLNVYISADLEGVSNVIYPHQTFPSGGDSYLQAVNQLHNELNCIAGTLLSTNKVGKITINDAHGTMENVKIDLINKSVEIITGKPKPVSMMAGLDESYDCVFFVGYHAKAGSLNGVLAHTFSPEYLSVKLNGIEIGELELNSVYSSLKHVPVALLTGDDVVCEQAQHLGLKNTVSTKQAISTTSAKYKPQNILMQELKDKVHTIVAQDKSDWFNYNVIKSPYKMELTLLDRKKADLISLLPIIKRESANTVSYKMDKYDEVYKTLQFLTASL